MTEVHRRTTPLRMGSARDLALRVRTSAVAVAALTLAAGPHAAAAQGAPDGGPGAIARLSWLAGCWQAQAGVEERWTDGAGGQMFGMSRSFRNGRAVRWEFLRIYEGRTSLIYAAAPSHQPPAEFEAAVATDDSAVFRNPQHDFPTSITYRRVRGDSLVAVVSGPGDEASPRSFAIPYARVSCDVADGKGG